MTLASCSPVACCHRVERGERPLAHVILEALGGEPLVRVDPRDHEHRVALAHRPADERVLRPQVEDVELVDPRRDDQQRPPFAPFRSSARTGSAASGRSGRRPCRASRRRSRRCWNAAMSVMLIASRPLPRSRSSSRFLQPVDQVLAAALDRRAQHLRVGQHEIRRRDRVDELPRIEIDLARGVLVEPLDFADRALDRSARSADSSA